jgi:hypothetical protein
MRTRAMTAMAAFAVLVGVGACSGGSDNAGSTGGDAGTAGSPAAGTDAGTAGTAGTGTTGMSGGTVGTPTTGTTGAAADSTRRADSMRTDSINRASGRP